MITLLIVAAIWMNEYLDNRCHMSRTTGTTYAFPNRWNIYRNFERLQYSLEFSKLHWKYRCEHIRIHCPPNPGSQYFNYKQYHSIVLQADVDANLKFVTMDVGAYVNKAMVESSETRLCIRAWKQEVCKCLRIQFCHIVKWHYLTFLLVTKRIF